MNRSQLNKDRLSKVFPPLAAKMEKLIALCEAAGVDLLVTQSLRTVEEQNALFAQGRTLPGKRVTNARGGQSYHNFGLAVDVVPLDSLGKADWDASHPAWETMGQLAESIGLEWGARWKTFKDIPHLQLTGGTKLVELRLRYAEGGLPKCWSLVENRLA